LGPHDVGGDVGQVVEVSQCLLAREIEDRQPDGWAGDGGRSDMDGPGQLTAQDEHRTGSARIERPEARSEAVDGVGREVEER